MVHTRLLAQTFTLLGCLCALIACGGDDGGQPNPTGGTGGAGGSGEAGGGGGGVEDEWQLDRTKPLSESKPELAEAEHPLDPTPLWGAVTGPRPTNATWMNLVLGQGDQRINIYPYDVKAVGQGLSISRPSLMAQGTSVTTPDISQIRLSTTQPMTGHVIKKHDLLSVTVEWAAAGGTMLAPLVYGSPYVTARYAGLPPSVLPGEGAAIIGVNGAMASPINGDRFEVSLNNGQTWVVYASPPIELQWTAIGMLANEPYTGTLRVALVPSPEAAAVLDAHASAIPLGGDIQAAIVADTATVRFTWEKEGDGELLTMALPHHVERLRSAPIPGLSYPTVKGEMKAVEGATWTLSYALSPLSWDAPRAVDPDRRADVEAALAEDKAYVPDATIVDKDPYFGGKQLAKLARIAQIADALGDVEAAAEVRTRLKPLLAAWLDGMNSNPLLFETTWGGLVTTNGVADPGVDFGQGFYNDHHFHYGYLIYAAAVLAKGDEDFRSKYAERVIWLIRDIANPSAQDPYFTSFRHMDWFSGHSWAAGLFPFGDGRNQESTSEAINAWYALQLFGNATGNEDIANLGRLLLSVETASAQTYWQVTSQSDIYPSPFKDNHGVGVLWSTKVDFATFFGTKPEFVYGIQLLPITPISESSVSSTWITDAWPQMESAAATAEESWRGILQMAHAIIDKDAAWEEVKALTAFDDGNSRTATLYWVATRP